MTEDALRHRYQLLLTEQGTGIRAAADAGDVRCARIIEAQSALNKKWNEATAQALITDLESYVDETRNVGWFPAPPSFAAWLVALAGVQPGHDVLEPSAGEGAIVSVLTSIGARVTAVERHLGRRAKLKSRAWADVMVLDHDDFLEMPRGAFDRIVMSPPFYRSGIGDHLDHVQHAQTMLRPGGVLVACLPITTHRSVDDRTFEFRAFISHLCGEWLAVSEQPFAARVVVLRLTRP
jgi:hypothetical protein